MDEKVDKSLQEDEKKLLKVKQSNVEKINRAKTELKKCKILFDGFVADISTSLRNLSLTEIIRNSENVKSTFENLSKDLLNEAKDLDFTISTPR